MDEPTKEKKRDPISQVLFYRLFRRNLTRQEARRLIYDVVNIVRDGNHMYSDSVNRRLSRLGWGDQAVDRFSYELILYLIENEMLCDRDLLQ